MQVTQRSHRRSINLRDKHVLNSYTKWGREMEFAMATSEINAFKNEKIEKTEEKKLSPALVNYIMETPLRIRKVNNPESEGIKLFKPHYIMRTSHDQINRSEDRKQAVNESFCVRSCSSKKKTHFLTVVSRLPFSREQKRFSF